MLPVNWTARFELTTYSKYKNKESISLFLFPPIVCVCFNLDELLECPQFAEVE